MNLLSKQNLEKITEWRDIAAEIGGVILIDKEKDWTSFDVVAKLRNLFKIKKVGHAGTLDPLATGLLILCCGKATKTIESYQNLEKIYTGKIKFGATTKTDDSEAEEENLKDTSSLTIENIQSKVQELVGEIDQIPPKFSAKKIKGKKLYELARKNIEIEIKPSKVSVYEFNVINFVNSYSEFLVRCSKGTYIRSLARDLGQKLGSGAYLSELRRNAIGNYKVENALIIDEIINNYQQ